MTVFFTGCTHFDHKNIIKLANRPFGDVDEMNERLVENWNAKVRPGDRVYHLGDIAWSDPYHWFDRLNGQKIVILGNHDCVDADHPKVYPYHEIRMGGGHIVLFHYPIDDWNGRWRGSIHLHCHTHSKQFRNPNIPFVGDSALELPDRFPADIHCNRFNVGVDACDFAPVAYEEIIDEAMR